MRRLPCTLALVLGACSVETPEPTLGCRALSECPLEQVCDVPSGQCIPEPPNRVLGRFSCEVIQGLPPKVLLPGSEVIVRVGDVRAVMALGASCYFSEKSDLLGLAWADFTSTFALAVFLDAGRAAAGGRHQIGVYSSLRDSGDLHVVATSQYLGTTAGGFVDLQPAVLGRVIEGYIDVSMFEVIDQRGIAGVPCPRGQADCGKDMEGPFWTFCGSDPPRPDYCTNLCDLDAECDARGGAICIGNCSDCSKRGFCVRPCTTDSDCIAPLRCVTAAGESRKVCL